MKKILLPIKPEYVNKIFLGEKKVEYRKKIISDVETIIVYATIPVQRIVAEFQVESILSGSPEELWIETKEMGGIDEDAYFNYFKNSDKAYAYVISQLKIYEKPISLFDLGITRPPQNFQYIE